MRIIGYARRHLGDARAQIPLAVFVAVVTYAAYWYIEVRPPEPFHPIEVAGLIVTSETVVAGGQGTVLNGFCLEAEEPLTVAIVIGMQRIVEDQIVDGEVYVLQDESLPVDPGCIALNEPLTFDVPASAALGTYRLYISLSVNGPGGRVQNETETSNTFEVTR